MATLQSHPNQFTAEDWVPLYTPDGLWKHLPAALSTFVNTGPPSLTVVVPISHDLQLFPQKWLIFCQISKFSFRLGTSAKFPRFATSWIIFNQSGSKWPTIANFAIEVARIGLKWPILVNFQLFPSFPSKSGSDWLRMANFAWFAIFPIFSHQVV